MREVNCDICGQPAEYVDNKEVYGGRSYGRWPFIWLCRSCDAYVGTHPGSDNPLGTLANPFTRQARKEAHDIFDRLWAKGDKSVFDSRGAAYRWMRQIMGLSKEDAHIGRMTAGQCKLLIDHCKELIKKRGERDG